MPKCAFCGNQIKKGTGKLFIYNSGKTDYFCSHKCETNLLVLKRKPLKIRWTEAYRKEHKKGLKEEVPKAEEKLAKVSKEKVVKEPKAEKAPKVKDAYVEESKVEESKEE